MSRRDPKWRKRATEEAAGIIERLRVEKGWSVTEIAARMGVGTPTVYEWLKKEKAPGPQRLWRLRAMLSPPPPTQITQAASFPSVSAPGRVIMLAALSGACTAIGYAILRREATT